MIGLTVESIAGRVERVDSGCWEWCGARTSAGYGHHPRRANGERGRTYAHRLSYELHHGPIPDGMVVRHKCDNPPCVNPDHLEVGTQGDNVRDTHSRGRFVPVTKLTAEQVQEIRSEPTRRGVLQHLAEKHGVSHHYVTKLRSGRHWKELGEWTGEDMRGVKATNLSARVGSEDSVLADGSFIYAVSVQPKWVYVRALRKDGKFVKRRYKHDQIVGVAE